MQPTRHRILEILKEQGNATVAELARQLDMAAVSVRHHLDVLQGENLIWTPRVRRRGTVGRPQQVYALTEAANAHFPNNHPALVVTMLDELKGVLSAAELNILFDRMAFKMAAEAPAIPDNANLEQRVENAVDFLNEKGYLARWEKQENAILLYTVNCPYAGVAENHRELCQMDRQLMEHLLGSSPQVVTRLSEGGCRCAYQVNGAPS